MTALLVALGVGAQPILNNFTSGLLLVLFRPFRVGDDVQVGDELFTVQAITAFFVTGTTFKNLHISLPNSTVLASTRPLTNYTANTSLNLELSVHVHAGQQPCAAAAAMSAAAAAYEAGSLRPSRRARWPTRTPSRRRRRLPLCQAVRHHRAWRAVDVSRLCLSLRV